MRVLITSVVDLERSAHNRLHRLLDVLAADHDVTVLSLTDPWKGKQVDASLYAGAHQAGLARARFHPIGPPGRSPILQEVLSRSNVRRLVRTQGPFDLHFNYNTLLSGLAAARALGRATPTIYDLADDLPAMIRHSPQVPRPLRPIGASVGAWAVTQNIRRSAAVTYITPALAKDAGVPEEKAKYLPNGVDTDAFCATDASELRRKLGLEGRFVLGYVGVLREWVDLRGVLAGLARLSEDVSLLVVGSEGGGMDAIRAEARRLGVGHRLLTPGTVPYSEVPAYINAMDVGLIPFDQSDISKNSLPLKLFEYMACERPVISSPLPGVAAAVGDRVDYAYTADEIAEAVTRLRSDPGGARARAKEGRAHIVNEYSWRGVGNRLRRIVAQVMGS